MIILDIREKHLSELETDIWRYRNARCLLASNNALKSPLCLSATLKKLLYVDLSNCQLTSIYDQQTWARLPVLRYLVLDDNCISDPEEFCYLKGCNESLISLSYVGNPVDGEKSE